MNPQLQNMLSQVAQAFHLGDCDGANFILREVLRADLHNADTILELGIAYAKANKLAEASTIFYCLLNSKNDDVRIPYNLGLILSLRGMHQLALEAYDLALKIQPRDVATLVNKGATLNDIKKHTLALEVLENAIKISPNIPEAWSNKGIALCNLNLFKESISAYNEAIKLNPDYHEAWSNKSVPLNKLNRPLEAFDACDKALKLNPDYAEGWSNKGITLHKLKRYDEALIDYDKALSLKPDYAEGWSNKGITLHKLKRYDEALIDYGKALSLKPDYAEGWSNKAVSFHELKRYDEALIHYDKALSLKPDYVEGWSNKGMTFQELERWDEAIACYSHAIRIKPNYDYLLGNLVHAKMKICSWDNLVTLQEDLIKKINANSKSSLPFPILSLTDSPAITQQCTKIYVDDEYPSNPILGPIPKRCRSKKIRLGYFSADFGDHPVSYLTVELFENHDQEQFEVFAFSLKNRTQDPFFHRIKNAFDQIIDVTNKSDQEVAQLARELQIDIAVNLGGFTQDERTGIFAYRAAPIQINWLGYAGTSAAEYFDYLIADQITIPKSNQQYYTEKVLYIPHTYMVDDSRRVASSRVFTKSECGLPQDAFIFCCFNAGYKFNPSLLDTWSRILLSVKNSVLWISENNLSFKTNLTTEFSKRGISPDRIIYAQKEMLMADHLARHTLADLFLDTHPYNAHSTAIDSLKAGLPIITYLGQSFASRVAASLLTAIGLPELITATPKDYEELAIDLATNPPKLAAIRNKLMANRFTCPLFNAPLFAKNIEAIYTQIMEHNGWAD